MMDQGGTVITATAALQNFQLHLTPATVIKKTMEPNFHDLNIYFIIPVLMRQLSERV
jgi:hypothetical protein